MSIQLQKHRLLASTIVAGSLFAAAPAWAQQDPGQGATPVAPVIGGSSSAATPVSSDGTDASGNASAGQSGEIIVTGSRIASPNLTSTSPLTVVNAQEFKLTGATRVEDVLQQLPQVTLDDSSTDNNAATGTASVSLRNLGSQRTLVLINGRRLVPGDPNNPVPDINFIPASLIQRVDVLTGGASSVYGADAVAGVVNFIMNKNFEGFQVDAQYSGYTHDNDTSKLVKQALANANYDAPSGSTFDGYTKNISVTVGAGTPDGKGHVVAYATYRQIDAITAGDRDFSYCGLTFAGDGTASCGGSSTSGAGRFRVTQQTGVSPVGAPIYGAVGPSYSVSGNQLVPGYPLFNYNPYNYFSRPDQRFTLGTFAHYQVSDAFDPYLEAMFMDDKSTGVSAPSGAFYGTDFFVNCNNALASQQELATLCGANANTNTLQSIYLGRRNVEGGGRIDERRHTAYRIVIGARGDIAKGVSYDAYGQMGRTIQSQRYSNDFSISRLNNALNVVTGPNGQPACAVSVPDATGRVQDANCVPYNIFTTGGVDAAALDYLQTPGFSTGETTEWVASGSITVQGGEYGVQSPWADHGVGLAFGAEYRRELLSQHFDTEFQTGDLAGQGTPFGVKDVSGSYDVREGFAELNVPIVEHKPFFEDLEANASYRYSSYNTGFNTNTYKGGLEYAPTKDIRFRGSYNRAVRAPNIVELFAPQTVGLYPTDTDPCAGPLDANGTTVQGNTFAQCARSGVTAAQFGNIDPSPANQYNQRTSGSTTLKPETADTITAGAVITPTFLPNFVFTADYYDIKIKNTIGTFGADYTLKQCVATGNPLFCDRVVRASGSLWTGNSYVDNPYQNLGKQSTRGVDVSTSYRYNTDKLGSFGFDLSGTYLLKYKVQPLPSDISTDSYTCQGKYGTTCGIPLPKWRHKLRVTWNTPFDLQVSGSWRFYGKVHNEDDTALSPDNKIAAQSYFDLTLSKRIADKYTMRIGAQNVLDRSPPVRSSAYGTNTATNVYSSVYDALGRYIYLGITLDL